MACALVAHDRSSEVHQTYNNRASVLCLAAAEERNVLAELAEQISASGKALVQFASRCDSVEPSVSESAAADMLIMTPNSCRRLFPRDGDVPLRAVRMLGKPILFLHGEAMGSVARLRHGAAVAAVSLSERSRQVVDRAAWLAAALSAPVRIVHVVDALHDFSRPDNLMGLSCACELLGRSAACGATHPEVRVCHGSICEALTRTVLRDARFLALGVDPIESPSTDAMLQQIVKECTCPILLVPTASEKL